MNKIFQCIEAKNKTLFKTSTRFMVKGVRGCIALRFRFSEHWNGLKKQVNILCRGKTYTFDVDDNGEVVDLDDEIFSQAGEFKLFLVGTGGTGDIVTSKLTYTIHNNDWN